MTRDVKPAVQKAMQEIHRKALKAAGQDRPALVCECGHSLEAHTHADGSTHCKLGMDPTMTLNGEPLFSKCERWKPRRTTVKEARKVLKREEQGA